MKNANPIITIANKANHFLIRAGMVSLFITNTKPKAMATMMKIRLIDGSIPIVLFTSVIKHENELRFH